MNTRTRGRCDSRSLRKLRHPPKASGRVLRSRSPGFEVTRRDRAESRTILSPHQNPDGFYRVDVTGGITTFFVLSGGVSFGPFPTGST
jgi:hypothetical protein